MTYARSSAYMSFFFFQNKHLDGNMEAHLVPAVLRICEFLLGEGVGDFVFDRLSKKQKNPVIALCYCSGK